MSLLLRHHRLLVLVAAHAARPTHLLLQRDAHGQINSTTTILINVLSAFAMSTQLQILSPTTTWLQNILMFLRILRNADALGRYPRLPMKATRTMMQIWHHLLLWRYTPLRHHLSRQFQTHMRDMYLQTRT